MYRALYAMPCKDIAMYWVQCLVNVKGSPSGYVDYSDARKSSVKQDSRAKSSSWSPRKPRQSAASSSPSRRRLFVGRLFVHGDAATFLKRWPAATKSIVTPLAALQPRSCLFFHGTLVSPSLLFILQSSWVSWLGCLHRRTKTFWFRAIVLVEASGFSTV